MSSKLMTLVVLAFLFSTFRAQAQNGRIVQMQAFAIPATWAQKIARTPQKFSYLDSIEIRQLTYLSDGLRVKGYLVYPGAAGLYPAIIYNRGGNREFGAITAVKVIRILARVASWGYVVAASQYRGNRGGEGREQFGGADVNDVLNLIPLLASVPGADTSRLGIYGWSRGGMMTYLALKQSHRFKAAVVGGGLSDLFLMKKTRPDMEEVYQELIPGYANLRDSSLVLRSAVKWPEKIAKNTPILILHGTADWRCVPQMALDLAEKFLRVHQPFRLVMLEGGDHGLTEFNDQVDQYVREWFDHYLRDRAPLPNLTPHGR